MESYLIMNDPAAKLRGIYSSKNNNMNTQANPLLSHTKEGIIETPACNSATKQKPIRILYFTDPLCSSCFGIEPQLRKLQLEYGDVIEMEYRMGGLLPSWNVYSGGRISKPSEAVNQADGMSAFFEMPIDGDAWLADPFNSSYPPCIAFKAAQMQNQHKALLFLRRIKEMAFLEKKDVAKWEHLQMAAKDVLLNPLQLKADSEGKAGALFQSDLDLARKLNVMAFPTLFFADKFNNREIVYGFRAYETFENIVTKLHPCAVKNPINNWWESLFNHYASFTTNEFSILSNQTAQEAKIQLNNLYKQKKIRKISFKNGTLWRKKWPYVETKMRKQAETISDNGENVLAIQSFSAAVMCFYLMLVTGCLMA